VKKFDFSKGSLTLCCGFILILSVSTFATDSEKVENPYDMSFEELSKLTFYTASRRSTSNAESPAVISVITRQEIDRRGYKTLHEALGKLPGFFNGSSPAWPTISNRGFIQDQNLQYLYLVDGHAINNTAYLGAGYMHALPLLEKVERIEVIRGPGSTLWGSNAGLGIIHIITRRAKDFDVNDPEDFGTLKLTGDYEAFHERQVFTLQYGKQFTEGEVMLTVSGMDSEADWTDSYKPGSYDIERQDALYHAKYGGLSRSMSLWDYQPSWDVYLNARYEDLTLLMRYSELTTLAPFRTDHERTYEDGQKQTSNFIELRYTPQLNEITSLELRTFYNWIYYEVHNSSGPQRVINRRGFRGGGAEAILRLDTDDHSLLGGVFAERNRQIDTKSPGDNAFNDTEVNTAIFSEYTWRGLENWWFTLGGRLDHNNLRDEGDVFLPRLAAGHKISEDWNIKYTYNTGFIRPTMRTIIDSPDVSSQETESHDLQLLYSREDFSASLTLFISKISDLIVFFPEPIGSHRNASDVDMYGLEFEFKYQIQEDLQIYGNYAYAESEYAKRYLYADDGSLALDLAQDSTVMDEDGRVTGVPRHIWNFGIDYEIAPSTYLNLHYRGWTDAVVKWSGNDGGGPDPILAFKRLGPQHYFDLNLRVENAFNKEGLDTSFYIKNIFDNQEGIPDGVNGGYIENPLGIMIGMQLSYTF
jgi:outer membrane receptor protein involved in Fe transport